MSTEPDDLHIGRAILDQGLASRDEVVDCIIEAARERHGGRYGRPLGVILVDRGLIGEDQLAQILARRVDPGRQDVTQMADIALGKLFVASGYVSAEQVDECLKEQKRRKEAGGAAGRLGELLVELGYATNQQVLRVLAYQSKRIYECPVCKGRFNVASPKPGSVYRCKKCQQPLQPVGRASGDSLTGTRNIDVPKAATDRRQSDQAEIDRAVAIYLGQKELVRADHLREADRILMEIARYGQVVPLLDVLVRTGALSQDKKRELEGADFAALVRKPGWAAQSIPGYRLGEKIATGGLSITYRADPVFGGPPVSIKVLHHDFAKNDAVVARFRNEGAFLRKFNHPGIVRGIGAEEHQGTHFIVMEKIEGRALGQRLSESGAFGLLQALQTVRQVGETLRYLHGQGFAHRDIKPDTILLDTSGKARFLSLVHVAPAGEAGRSADLFLLGITLYAMLTGMEPFAGAPAEESAGAQLEAGLPAPNLMMLQAPPPVVRLLKRLLHHDPARRFQTAQDLLLAMDGRR